MANSKIDNQMERMQFLMEYKTTPKVDTKAGIEYSINTADGKTYGIIRENNMYYIKTTTPDKATIKESYEYLGGYNYRNEHGYKSFNEATKHLELEIMGINESLGKHEDVSVVLNPNKGKEDMQTLTEAARTELNRMHQIFENSGKIGHYKNPFTDPESKGTGDANKTEYNNAPFENKAEATLDKDPKFNGTVDGATPDNKNVTVTDAELDSVKMKTANSGSEKDFKPTHDDLDGEGVADKTPSGAKAVKENVNEGIMEDEPMADDTISGEDFGEEPVPGEGPVDNFGEPLGDESGLAGFDGEGLGDDDINLDLGLDDEESDLDSLLQEFMDVKPEVRTGNIGLNGDGNTIAPQTNATIPIAENNEGSEDILKGEPSTLEGDAGKGDNNVHGEETMDRVDEDAENHEAEGAGEKESKLIGPDGVMDSEEGAGSLPAQTWDKLQESIDRITESIFDKLTGNKKSKKEEERNSLKSAKTDEEYLQESIDRIVAEEVKKLDAWGKHPRYQKPAFKTPANKEVAPNDAKDWNDDSTKGEEAYGKKIGSSAPFDKAVDVLTDAVVKHIMESYGVKKK